AGVPETISERSSFSCLRMPAYVVEYLNPSGKSKGLIVPVVLYSSVDDRWRKLPPAYVYGLRVVIPVIPERLHHPQRQIHLRDVREPPAPDSAFRRQGANAKDARIAPGTSYALPAKVATLLLNYEWFWQAVSSRHVHPPF